MIEKSGYIPFALDATERNTNKNRFWLVERCWNCPNANIDIEKLENNISKVMEEVDFEMLRQNVLNTNKPMHHQVFRISVSGCPNSCSQPQIKDLGIQGQAVPGVGEGCNLCEECVKACPDDCITLLDNPVIDRESCLNCGRCVRACPAGVLTNKAIGFRVLVGGKLGRHPRLAETAVVFGNEESVGSTLKAAVHLLTDPNFAKERLGTVIEKKGMDWFKGKI